MNNPKMFLLMVMLVGWASEDWAPGASECRESVEAYTPHNKERSCIAERGRRTIQIEKGELKVEAYTPHYEESNCIAKDHPT